MKRFNFLIIRFFIIGFFVFGQSFSMNSNLNQMLQVDGYDSDSEDEDGYSYQGYKSMPSLVKNSFEGLLLFRGIHFSPSIFSKEDRSRERRGGRLGKPIFSRAVYDFAEKKCTDMNDSSGCELLEPLAKKIKSDIVELNDRDAFQKKYTNQYNVFLRNECNGFKETPQVSTSEIIMPANKYAYGVKFNCNGVEKLDPEYDKTGKPKHPYLGKVFVILVDTSEIKELSPYFLVNAHANKRINVSHHFSNDILSEREVCFPGFIPGKYVVYEKAVRVPSFSGEYKGYYEKKYGVTKLSFKSWQRKFKSGLLKQSSIANLIKKVMSHTAQALYKHVIKECQCQNIKIIYKGLNDGFVNSLPSLDDAKKSHKN